MNLLHLLVLGMFASVQFGSTIAECTGISPLEEKYLSLLKPLQGERVTVQDTSKNFTYTIGFCEEVEKTKNGGVRQDDLHSKETLHTIGRINVTNIVAGSNFIFLEYRNGDVYGHHCNHENRRATIFIICDPTNLVVAPTLVEENNDRDQECAYVFEMGSSVACTGSTPITPSSPSSGMSIGGVIVIVALSLAAAYLIFGVLYKRCVLGAKGREQFPNVGFWTKFGNLTADGCDFLCRCNNKKEDSKQYKGLGDDQLGLEEEEERDENILPMY